MEIIRMKHNDILQNMGGLESMSFINEYLTLFQGISSNGLNVTTIMGENMDEK